LLESGTEKLDLILDAVLTVKEIQVITINNIGLRLDHAQYEAMDPRIIVVHSSDNPLEFELPTLRFMHEFSLNSPNTKILYVHTKGISYPKGDSRYEPGLDWINYMLYFLCEKSENCLRLLDTHEVAGCNFSESPKPHFSGNFWWATAKYLKTLDTRLLTDKMSAEWWLHSGKPQKDVLWNSGKNHFLERYPRELYFTEFKSLDTCLSFITKDKNGIEIGGPSRHIAGTIYKNANLMDNVIFSSDTIWSKHASREYKYYDKKVGHVFINDAVNISDVSNNSYDFVFSSHSLEHIANPIKALKEWLRILRDDGHIILILPDKNTCFDHKREYSKISTLISQYEKNVGEDDLSTLPEILEKHDLSKDPPAGNLEQFKKRSLDNYNNRCLHHYVYNEQLLNEITTYLKCKFIYTKNENGNIWYVMKKQANRSFNECELSSTRGNMSTLIIISSKYPNPHLFSCIENLYKIQIKDDINYKICVIDSDSDNTTHYDNVKKHFPEVEIHFIKNKNYQYGAYKYAYKLYPTYNYYWCIQDTIIITKYIDTSIVNDKNIYSCFSFSGFYSHMSIKELGIKLLKDCNLDYSNIIDTYFNLATFNTFIITNNIIKDIFSTIKNAPVDKNEESVYERIYGIFFIRKHINTQDLTPYIHKIYGGRF
jgi:SAM-dependent methyltransferase